MKLHSQFFLAALILFIAPHPLRAQAPGAAPAAPAIEVPSWALPGSATHRQVPPPAGFHRPSKTFDTPIGIFEGQTDIGGPLLPGSASFDAGKKQYTLNSASYNIWYNRDELRYVWKKLSGDVSLAADITFPNTNGYSDRKAVLIIRQDLEDDSKEAMTALHGAGLIHLAQRPDKNANITESQRVAATPARAGDTPIRIGLEKKGDAFSLFVSLKGEPMHQAGSAMNLHFDGPFYAGIGFCSHVPDKSDTAVLTNVVFENAAGKVH
jgi:hypothetical protein